MAHQRLEFELLLDELFELLLLLELDELLLDVLLDVFELEFDELLFDVFELVLLDVLLLEFDDVLLEELFEVFELLLFDEFDELLLDELFELLELLLLEEPDGRERTRSTGPSSDEPKLLTPRLPSSLEFDELLLEELFDELLELFELLLLLEFDELLLDELLELLALLLFEELLDELLDEFELLLLDEFDDREGTRSTGPSSDEPKLLTPRLPSSLEFDELLLEELFDELLALFELLLLLEFEELLLDELLDELFDEFELLLLDEFDDPCDDPRERTFRPPSPEKRLLPPSRTPTRRNSAGKLPTVRSKGLSACPRSRKGATFCACAGAPASKPAMAAIRTLSLPFMIFISCRKTVPGKRQAAGRSAGLLHRRPHGVLAMYSDNALKKGLFRVEL